MQKKLLRASVLSLVVVLITAAFLVPLRSKVGTVRDTEGLCKEWPVKKHRYSLLRGQQKSFDAIVAPDDSTSTVFDAVCGQREQHTLYLL